MITYVVVQVFPNGLKRICFDGPNPYIGDRNGALRLANFLASIDPKSQFVLASLKMSKLKGKSNDVL